MGHPGRNLCLNQQSQNGTEKEEIAEPEISAIVEMSFLPFKYQAPVVLESEQRIDIPVRKAYVTYKNILLDLYLCCN